MPQEWSLKPWKQLQDPNARTLVLEQNVQSRGGDFTSTAAFMDITTWRLAFDGKYGGGGKR